MRIDHGCQNCRSKDFLGVECAWPASDCLAAAHTRRRRHLKWSLRAVVLAAALFLIAGAWQLLS